MTRQPVSISIAAISGVSDSSDLSILEQTAQISAARPTLLGICLTRKQEVDRAHLASPFVWLKTGAHGLECSGVRACLYEPGPSSVAGIPLST